MNHGAPLQDREHLPIYLHHHLSHLDFMELSWDGMLFVPPSADVSCPAFKV